MDKKGHESEQEYAHLINVERIVRNQNNKILKKMPRFLIRKIEKLVHQDRFNDAILRDKDKFGFDFIEANLEYLNITVQVSGLENIHENGRYIYVCNHAPGAIDFHAAIIAAHEKHPKMKVIANEILMAFYNLHTIFIPVNVFSRNGEDDKKKNYKVLETSDYQLLTFPSGTVARKYKGVLDDGKWHPSFVKNAVNFKRDVIPIFVDSENSRRFYRLSNLRRKIGIKANLELFLLADELFKKENSTINVIFGKPISYETFTDEKSAVDWAQHVKNMVYDLKTAEKKDTFELNFRKS
jgi:putative hemolysin